MAPVALAVEVTPRQGERVVEAPATAGAGGDVGAMVPGRHGLEEAWDLLAAAHGREACCGLSSHARQGVPVASQDLWVDATARAVTEAHGAGREALAVVAMQEGVWPGRCGDAVGGFGGALRQQADRSASGLWRPCALATALQSGDHGLAQWCHDRPPVVR